MISEPLKQGSASYIQENDLTIVRYYLMGGRLRPGKHAYCWQIAK